MISESDMEMNDTVKSQPKSKTYPEAHSENSHSTQDQVKVWISMHF